MQTTTSAADQTNLCRVFGALADPIRLSIFERLVHDGEVTAGKVAEPYDVSLPAISRHLGVLERAGLIERRVERQWRVCRPRPEAVTAAADWLERQRAFWNESLDRLERLLADADADKDRNKENKEGNGDG